MISKSESTSSPIKVLITTSGLGSRLGDLTSFTNKSLVKVGDKLALSHVIDCYPTETNFVITLGHFGNQVRDFLELAYPRHNFTFIEVEKYEGEGSSLGLSMLTASEFLQEPFIFHASDTLISPEEVILDRSQDWVAGYRGKTAAQYASFDATSGNVMKFHPKGSMKFDYIHIGLVGIYSYKEFWENLKNEYLKNPNEHSLNDLSALKLLLKQSRVFKVKEVKTWIDIGNTESLLNARKFFGQKYGVLEKPDESISFVGNSVIKFFADETIAKNRVKRAKILKGIAPEVVGNKGSFYKYDFINGDLVSEMTAPPIDSLLRWSEVHLWNKHEEISAVEFQSLCMNFYRTKTLSRIDNFLEKSRFDERNSNINGIEIPSIFELMSLVDFDYLASGVQSKFHGDFILDNILETCDGFKLIDWRQDFGGSLMSGDVYYDLAKLNHSLIVNHEIVNQNHFTIVITENGITCDIHRKNELVECGEILHRYISENGYDLKKVRILSAIIWLNMAPLHHHPFDLFLFNFGKLHLWRALHHG